MKIGIFGGTFDPPHMGHILLANKAIKQCGLDKLLILPSANPPHKKADSSKEHRLNLARLVAEEYGFELCDWEYNKTTPSYTVETIGYMKEKYPEDKLFFIIGGDSMLDFEKWYKWQELLTKCAFVVGIRNSAQYEAVEKAVQEKREKYGAEIYVLEIEPIEISSTEIREDVDLSYMPPCIWEYIKKNNLYGK